ncbi:hypothetical protein NON20_03415 [Synechocystis sp. B12]|nr:hypothetical protein NON20_03415 [Synechocystis sp. B12]
MSAQLVIQALMALSGIIIVRTLGKQEYAYFTIANSLQSTMNILSDIGISISLMSIGGKIWQDKYLFGKLINTAKQLRTYFMIVAIILVTPILLWMLITNASSLIYATLIAVVVLVELYFYTINGIYSVVLQLNSQFDKIQYISLLSSFSRLTLLATSNLFFLNSLVATLISTISSGLQSRLIADSANKHLVINSPISKKYRKDILKITKNQLPSTVYYCFQGQLNVLLITIFGNTNNIAEIGALGRLSIIFMLLNSIMSQILIPSFAKCMPHLLVDKYIKIVSFYSFIGLSIVLCIVLFPKQILWIIGNNYAHLENELVLMSFQVVISSIIGLMWSLNASRAWIQYVWIYVPATLITQIFLILNLNLSTVSGIIYFQLLSSLPFLFVNLALTFAGIKRDKLIKSGL